MRLPTPALTLNDGQRAVLSGIARAQSLPYRDVIQAKALLLAERGAPNTEIGARLGVSPTSVARWRVRFSTEGLKDLGKVREGRGRRPSISKAKVDAIVHATLHTTPPGETHWSCRSMARTQGVSPATIQRIWSVRKIQPHRVETFKLSNDPKFEEKLVDIVGLYHNPPENAVVLCMDEKSQIQALDRTQRTLPMKRGRAGTMTHDYKRHGARRAYRKGNRRMPSSPSP